VNLSTTDPAKTPEVGSIKINYLENDSSNSEVAYVIAEKDGVKYRYDKTGAFLNVEEGGRVFITIARTGW
jgi:hypothetical protein